MKRVKTVSLRIPLRPMCPECSYLMDFKDPNEVNGFSLSCVNDNCQNTKKYKCPSVTSSVEETIT